MNLFVKDTETLKKFLTLESDVKMPMFEPYLAAAQETYLVRMFGRSFMDTLLDRYAAPTPNPGLTSLEQTLIFHLQAMQAHFASVEALPYLIVSVSGAGVMQRDAQNRKSVALWQKIEFENGHLEQAYTAAENALKILWENRDHAQFAGWKNSEAEARSVSTVLYSAEQFDECYAINTSRRTFEALRSSVNTAERRLITVIGKALYNELTTQVKTFSISEQNAKLLPYLRNAIAFNAIAISIPRLPFKVTADGIMVVSGASRPDVYKNQNAADPDGRDQLLHDAQAGYAEKLAELQDFLKDNLSDYPLYLASAEYKAQITNTQLNDRNSKTIML